MRLFIFFALLFSYWQTTLAQVTVQYDDETIREMVEVHTSTLRNNPEIPGYRIHIYSDMKRDLVLEMRSRFMQVFPTIDSYVEYVKPEFKLRLGNFIDKNVANKYIRKIKSEFPSAYIVQDNVLRTRIVFE